MPDKDLQTPLEEVKEEQLQPETTEQQPEVPEVPEEVVEEPAEEPAQQEEKPEPEIIEQEQEPISEEPEKPAETETKTEAEPEFEPEPEAEAEPSKPSQEKTEEVEEQETEEKQEPDKRQAKREKRRQRKERKEREKREKREKAKLEKEKREQEKLEKEKLKKEKLEQEKLEKEKLKEEKLEKKERPDVEEEAGDSLDEKKEEPKKEPEEKEKEKPALKGRKEAKKKRKKRKKSKNYLLRILIAMGLIAALIVVMHLDYFNVQKVTVTGNDLVSEKQILEGTNIKKGENIFDIHFFLEKRKIMENLYIEDVQFKRDLPDKVIVTVSERRGLAQLHSGNSFTVIDNDGRVIEVSKEQREITTIEGFETIDAQKGSRVKLRDEEGFDKTMELLAAVDDNDMFFKKVAVKDGRVAATIYAKIKVSGSYANVMDAIESGTLKTVVYDIYQKGKKKGTIIVSGDNYCSFTE